MSCDSYLCDVELTIQEVQESLLALDTTKATGPDGIPCRLLKETARQIAPSLTQLYNLSLLQGVLPEDWKLANIIPVHKKGEREHAENYRPISLLSIVSKVLERCLLSRIRDHLLDFIKKVQHGFIYPGSRAPLSCSKSLKRLAPCWMLGSRRMSSIWT